MTDWKMYPDEVSKLIDLYGQNECLWNCQNEDYKRTDLKRSAWQQLSRHFGKSVDDMKRKIKYLRSAYLHEKKRVDDSRRNVRPGSSVYRPRLFYYRNFKFLDPVIILRKATTPTPEPDSYIERLDEPDDQELSPNPENEASDEIENFILIEEANTQQIPPAATFQSAPAEKVSTSLRTKRKTKRRSSPTALRFEEVVDPFGCGSSKTATEESIYSAFGKTISLQLGLLSPLEATSTMATIHQLLSKKIMRSMVAARKDRRYSSSEDSDNLNGAQYGQYNSKRPKHPKYED